MRKVGYFFVLGAAAIAMGIGFLFGLILSPLIFGFEAAQEKVEAFVNDAADKADARRASAAEKQAAQP